MAPVGAEDGFLLQGLVVMLLGSFVVGIRCSGAVTGERERQTWEAVLLTPLSAKQLVHGKLWGVMAACYWYLLAYAVPAVLLSALGGGGSLGWTVLWLAVTVLAMYFMGAAGLWCSVRSKTSWRSLLGTMALGYLGGLLLYLITSPFVGLLALLVILMLWLVDSWLKTGFAASAEACGAPGGRRFTWRRAWHWGSSSCWRRGCSSAGRSAGSPTASAPGTGTRNPSTAGRGGRRCMRRGTTRESHVSPSSCGTLSRSSSISGASRRGTPAAAGRRG